MEGGQEGKRGHGDGWRKMDGGVEGWRDGREECIGGWVEDREDMEGHKLCRSLQHCAFFSCSLPWFLWLPLSSSCSCSLLPTELNTRVFVLRFRGTKATSTLGQSTTSLGTPLTSGRGGAGKGMEAWGRRCGDPNSLGRGWDALLKTQTPSNAWEHKWWGADVWQGAFSHALGLACFVPDAHLHGLPRQVLCELHPPVPVSQGAVPGGQPHWSPTHL